MDPSISPEIYYMKFWFLGFKGFNECVLSLILHYSCYMSCVLYFKPELEVSIGVHEKTGPCNETSPVQTAFGMVCGGTSFLNIALNMCRFIFQILIDLEET